MTKTVVRLLVAALLVVGYQSQAQAVDHNGHRLYAAGVSLGIRAADRITLYVDLDEHSFIQGAMGFDTFDGGLDLDVELVMLAPLVFEQQPNLRLYYGVGSALVKEARFKLLGGKKLSEDTYVGIKVPLGVLLTLQEVPLQFYFEIVPGSVMFDEVRPFVHTIAGVRFYLY